jgi:hypothetical protein
MKEKIIVLINWKALYFLLWHLNTDNDNLAFVWDWQQLIWAANSERYLWSLSLYEQNIESESDFLSTKSQSTWTENTEK